MECIEEQSLSFFLFYTWKPNTSVGFLLPPLSIYTSSSKRGQQGVLTKGLIGAGKGLISSSSSSLLEANHRDLYSFSSLPTLGTNLRIIQPGSRISYTFRSRKYLIMRPCIFIAFLFMTNLGRFLQ